MAKNFWSNKQWDAQSFNKQWDEQSFAMKTSLLLQILFFSLMNSCSFCKPLTNHQFLSWQTTLTIVQLPKNRWCHSTTQHLTSRSPEPKLWVEFEPGLLKLNCINSTFCLTPPTVRDGLLVTKHTAPVQTQKEHLPLSTVRI